MIEPNTCDFGNISGDTFVEKKLKVVNKGSQATIISLTSSCGCTESKISKRVIGSGETADLLVHFSPKGRRGAVHEFIIIQYNNNKTNIINIPVNSEIKRSLEVIPQNISFGDIRHKDLPIVKNFVIRIASTSSDMLPKITLCYPGMSLGPLRKISAGIYESEINLDSHLPFGPFSAKCFVKTSLSEETISLNGRLLSNNYVVPETLYFGPVYPLSSVTKKVRLNHGSINRTKVIFSSIRTPDFSISHKDNIINFTVNANKDEFDFSGFLYIYVKQIPVPICVPFFGQISDGGGND